MAEKRVNRGRNCKSKGQQPRMSNDQLGENAGEGRLMKEQSKKEKRS